MQMREAVYTHTLCGGCVSHRRLCVPPASPITCLVPLSNTCAPSPPIHSGTGCFPSSVLEEGLLNYLPLLNTPVPILLPYLHNLPAQLPAMGNIPLLGQGNDGALTPFQRSKLIFDFNTFFDLNKDGVLSYKDFLWAKDRICQISGWKVISLGTMIPYE